jgi:uncharacterized membrane-anchored protein
VDVYSLTANVPLPFLSFLPTLTFQQNKIDGINNRILDQNQVDIAAEGLVTLDYTLNRIGFNQQQRDAIIETRACRHVAMIGLLSAEQVSKFFKRIETRMANPLVITTVQEQLLLQ